MQREHHLEPNLHFWVAASGFPGGVPFKTCVFMISSKGFCFPYKKGMKSRKPRPRWRSLWTEPFRGGWGNLRGKHTGRTIESFHCLFYVFLFFFFFKDFCGVRLGILTCLRNALIFLNPCHMSYVFFFKGNDSAMRSCFQDWAE